MRVYGLIGKHLNHSFSPAYFANKFKKEGIKDAVYQLFPLSNIEDLEGLLAVEPNLNGLNVTIPYKVEVLPFLDELSPPASAVGAVNTIKFDKGRLLGYNTDIDGFQASLEGCMSLEQRQSKALVLGTGGASKAVVYVLNRLGISHQYISRKSDNNQLSYKELNPSILKEHLIIINTTPLGMSPNLDACPNLPYAGIGAAHLLFDLVYNPAQTLFMKKGAANGARTMNGLEMLHLQAEKAWEIWQASNF